ncbi:MAG: DNA/RNA non-specific endonuclease [Gemmatimonadaceae bacterium]
MYPSINRALRIAALGLLLVACNADRVLAPSTSHPSPGRAQLATAAAVGSVIITEFLPDPNGTDTFGEWFELYNTGTTDVDLSGYTIGSFLADAHTISRSVIVPAGKCIVIGNNADLTTNGGVLQAYSYPASGAGSIVLNNGGTSSSATDWIALRDPSNAPIDSVSYGRYLFDAAGTRIPQDTLRGDWAVSPGVSYEVADVSASRTVVANNANWVKSTTTFVPPAPGGQTLRGTPGTCPGGTVTPPPPAGPVVSVAITPLATSASVGGTRQFTVTAKDANGVDATSSTTFTWLSSDPSIATISGTGLASGVAEGTTTITVTSANGTNASTTLTVIVASAGSVSLSMNTPREIIVGYTKPIFPTVRDAGGAVISVPLVWSSASPEIATVDALGYVTGVAPGTAIIKATALSGAFGTVSVQVDAPEPTSAIYRNHVEFGAPADADPSNDLIVAKTQFVLSYNASRGGPNWVSWNLNGTQFGAAPRCDCFSADLSLPSSVYRVVDFDYRNGGYDRGHMVQSESRTTTLTENSSTFLLTNILPQAAENNQGPWSRLENQLNDMVRTGGKEIYVVAGGIYAASPPTLKNEGKVAVPDYTWKIAVILSAGQGLANVKSATDLEVIAIKMPNLVGTTGPASATGIRNIPWETYKTTVDALEAETGYDFLAALPDAIETVVESNDRPPVAALTGPTTGVEGSVLTFDASASSDPDGDALTYSWSFGDGTTATGVSPTHIFADNGTFAVTLTVMDAAGATSTASLSVNVTNAAPVITGVNVPAVPTSVGVQATGTVTFTDAGAGDTHVATIEWGDGESSSVDAGSALQASATHAYTTAGFYTVTVTVRDDDGASATTHSSIVVVYDASAGSLNGSGWIPGASDGDKTRFGVDLRYRGGTTPVGTFHLAAQSGAIAFTSTSFAWLVVQGTVATFRGTAVLANGTDVGFQVTADDGNHTGDKTDRVRIRVWNLATGAMLFDSEPGASDFAAPTVPLGGGNVTVH